MKGQSTAEVIVDEFPSKGRANDDAFLRRLKNRRKRAAGTSSLRVISNDAVQSGTGLILVDGSDFIEVDGSNFIQVD